MTQLNGNGVSCRAVVGNTVTSRRPMSFKFGRVSNPFTLYQTQSKTLTFPVLMKLYKTTL